MTAIIRITLMVAVAVALNGCGSGALYQAAYKGDFQKVASLLAAGEKIEESDSKGWTPLMIASAEGHLKTVKLLLEKGANPNAKNRYGRTALMFAAHYGYTPIVEVLLESGADINIVPTDETRKTALIAAVDKGHYEVVSLLLRYKADTTIKEKLGFDALFSAAVAGNTKIAELLLNNGANPNTVNQQGNTPLLIAINE